MFTRGKIFSKRVLLVSVLLVGLLALLFAYTNCSAKRPGSHRLSAKRSVFSDTTSGALIPLTYIGHNLETLHEDIEPPIHEVFLGLSDSQMVIYVDDIQPYAQDQDALEIVLNRRGGECGVYADEVGSVQIVDECYRHAVQFNFFKSESIWYDVGSFVVPSGSRLPLSCQVPGDCSY